MTSNLSNWTQVSLSQILTYSEQLIDLDDDTEYITITVKRRHGGLESREKLLGTQIRTKKQFKLIPGSFIISRVQCWHQAYAIVPDNIESNMIASTNYDQFTISPEVDKRFFWWFSHSSFFTTLVRSCAFGVVIEKMVFNREKWLEKTIPLPPLEEQHRIVARIEELAAKIEEAGGLRREVLDEIDVLFQTQLGNTYAKLHEEYGSQELSNMLIEANYGTSVKCSIIRTEDSIPVLRIPNVVSEEINFNDLKYGVLGAELTKVLLCEGDILVVRTNGSADLVGRCAVVPPLTEATAFASYMIRLRCNQKIIVPDFLQLMLRYLRTGGQLIDFARTTAGQYNVSLGRLGSANIPLPPLGEQYSIISYFKETQTKINSLKLLQSQTSAELDALLPSILDKAFKGEL